MLALDMLASLLISLIGMVYPIVTNKMLNVYIPEKMYSTIVFAGLLVLVLYFIRMLMRYFVQYYGHLIGVKMQSRMRQDLFAHLEKLLPVQAHHREDGAKLNDKRESMHKGVAWSHMQHVLCNDHVACRGDRQKFSQALDDGYDYRLK